MAERLEAAGFRVPPGMEETLRALGAPPGGAARAAYEREYGRWAAAFAQAAAPRAAAAFGAAPRGLGLPEGEAVCWLALTLGDGPERLCAGLYAEGDYPAALLVDTMADLSLFAYDRALLPALRDACAARGYGVAARLEAPGSLPMRAQRLAAEAGPGELLGLSVTGGLMLRPVKSLAALLRLTPDKGVFRAAHGCQTCMESGCPHRGI